MARIGSYTTARVTGGRVERVERHARRLRRDAIRLGLPAPGLRDIEECLLETARNAFGMGDGMVRLEWSHAPHETPELRATTRELGEDPKTWRARTSTTIHPGPESRRNSKYVAVEAHRLAREEAVRHGVDEVLLFDADEHLVEGSITNLVIVDSDGRLVTPSLELGAVEGIGLMVLRENRPEIEEAIIARPDLDSAREVIATNAVRGVVPIVELDGIKIGSGEPGPWAIRLRKIFFRN